LDTTPVLKELYTREKEDGYVNKPISKTGLKE
jgi:hypothetical protein